MSVHIGTFSRGTTGNASVTGLSFLPTSIEFHISGRFNTTETRVQYSYGACYADYQVAHSIFHDSTGSRSKAYTDRCLNHFERVSGTITEVLNADWVSFNDNGGGDYGFTLNFVTANSNYQIHFIARD